MLTRYRVPGFRVFESGGGAEGNGDAQDNENDGSGRGENTGNLGGRGHVCGDASGVNRARIFMSKKQKLSLVPALVCALLLLFAVWFFGPAWIERLRAREDVVEVVSPVDTAASMRAVPRAGDDETEAAAALWGAREKAGAEWRELLRRKLERRAGRVKEAVIIFKDAEAYRKFKMRARVAGFSILAESEPLRAVRVKYETIAAVQADIFKNIRDYEEIGANTYVDQPARPPEEERAGYPLAAVGDGLLKTLGVTDDRKYSGLTPSVWGRGVTIAVLDSGVVADATFGAGRLRSLDIGEGVVPGRGEEDGHATAVASLAAGSSADAAGVAPAATVLSIRVTAEDGRSDIFTVAKGIVAAVDAGAKVINISLGGYDTSVLITRAVDYAEAAGAVIVAASGNDQLALLAWPAAEPRVISVGATDATGRQAAFSNSGDGLKITAPGVGVQAAWMDGKRVLFSGTSASAPVVSGAIAAVMSQRPGMSAREAWEILQARSDDGGAPGVDTEYGAGVLDVGWAMDTNPARVDLAVASHWLERRPEMAGADAIAGRDGGPAGGNGGAVRSAGAAGGVVDIVIQNRGGFPVAGATLEIEAGGVVSRQVVPVMAAGASAILKVSVDRSRVDADGRWVLKTTVVAPGGMVDQAPGNNERVSGLRAGGDGQ
jgi:hypothetical protein